MKSSVIFVPRLLTRSCILALYLSPMFPLGMRNALPCIVYIDDLLQEAPQQWRYVTDAPVKNIADRREKHSLPVTNQGPTLDRPFPFELGYL